MRTVDYMIVLHTTVAHTAQQFLQVCWFGFRPRLWLSFCVCFCTLSL